MVSLSDFLRGVGLNAHRVTKYEWGADGSKVTGQREEVRYENGQKVTYIITERPCDCIGLIMGGLELAGGKWPGKHGTNWAARHAIDGLSYVSGADQLFLGEIVFKAREPGESNYDLPEDYASSPDQRDYYHVGVVTQVSPLEITHCTSVDGGIKQDSSLGAWHYGGRLKYVEYNSGEDAKEPEPGPLYQAIVTAPTGKTVNLRKGPGMNYAVLEQVLIGETVGVLDVCMDGKGADGWNKVQRGPIIGYMMRKFLKETGDDVPPWEPPVDTTAGAVTVDRGTLRALRFEVLALADKLKALAGDTDE